MTVPVFRSTVQWIIPVPSVVDEADFFPLLNPNIYGQLVVSPSLVFLMNHFILLLSPATLPSFSSQSKSIISASYVIFLVSPFGIEMFVILNPSSVFTAETGVPSSHFILE